MQLNDRALNQHWRWKHPISSGLTRTAVAALTLGILLCSPSFAQRANGSMGVGLQAGRPGGVALKLYRSDRIAYDAILTTDGDDFVDGHFHRLWEQPLPDSPLHLYLGPGIIVGVDGLGQSTRGRFGVSTEVGLNFYAERFEVFLHVTPALRFFPNNRAYFNGSVGLRYYFGVP